MELTGWLAIEESGEPEIPGQTSRIRGRGWHSPEMGNSGGRLALQTVPVSSLAVQTEVVRRSFFSEKETRVVGRGWVGDGGTEVVFLKL